MDRKLANRLSQCLDMIENDGKTVNEVIDLFPDSAEELKTLLETVLFVENSATISPRQEYLSTGWVRVQNRIAASKGNLNQSKSVTFLQPERHKLYKLQNTQRRFSMSWLIIIATVASLILGGGGVAYASSDALPGDALYPAKTLIQEIGLALSGNEGDVDLLLDYMDGNLDELNELVSMGRWEDVPTGLEAYQENLAALVQTRSRISYLDAPNEDAINMRVQNELQLQIQELMKIQEKIQNKENIQNKIQNTIQQTDQGKTYGPSEGGPSPDNGTSNGAGPGEPAGTQNQQNQEYGDGSGNSRDGNNPDGEACQQQNGVNGEASEEEQPCGQQGDGNQGAGWGNGQGGKP